MKILVKYRERIYQMNEDGLFLCAHPNAEVTPPCCWRKDEDGLIACGCAGGYSVYCADCKNEDLTDEQVEEMIDASGY